MKRAQLLQLECHLLTLVWRSLKYFPCVTQSWSLGKKTRLEGIGCPGQVHKAGGGRQGWKENLPQALWSSVLSTIMCNPWVERGPISSPRRGRHRDITSVPVYAETQSVRLAYWHGVSEERAEIDSLPHHHLFTLSKPWSAGNLLPSDILLLAAGPVPRAEE